MKEERKNESTNEDSKSLTGVVIVSFYIVQVVDGSVLGLQIRVTW